MPAPTHFVVFEGAATAAAPQRVDVIVLHDTGHTEVNFRRCASPVGGPLCYSLCWRRGGKQLRQVILEQLQLFGPALRLKYLLRIEH